MESIIKWRTGVPKEDGEYLVTTEFGINIITYYKEFGYWGGWNNVVIAWCPMSEIKPYKE